MMNLIFILSIRTILNLIYLFNFIINWNHLFMDDPRFNLIMVINYVKIQMILKLCHLHLIINHFQLIIVIELNLDFEYPFNGKIKILFILLY
jgi:hypothetical protein